MSFAVRPMGLGASAPVGQVEWRTPGSFNWIVPAGVTEIHAVVVAASGNQLTGLRRGSTYFFTSNTALGAAVGGGNGGFGGNGSNNSNTGGGGGAGGYLGNGGAGGSVTPFEGPAPGTAGQGGGGGGGGASYGTSSGAGGGVGLKGVGASGAAGAMNTSGGVGSVPPDTAGVGAGMPGTTANSGGTGGNLRYTITPLSVTPGETLIVSVGGSPGYSGGIRIMWGGGRSYPSNAGDL